MQEGNSLTHGASLCPQATNTEDLAHVDERITHAEVAITTVQGRVQAVEDEVKEVQSVQKAQQVSDGPRRSERLAQRLAQIKREHIDID